MSSQVQASLLRQHLRDLQQMRTDAERFYRDMENKVLANKSTLNMQMKTVESIAFIGQCLIGVGKLVGMGAKSMGLVGKKLAESNAKVLKEVGSQALGKTRGIGGLIYETENPIVDLALNFDSPNYWAKKITGVNPEVLYSNLLAQIRAAKSNGIAKVDAYIKETQSKLRYCEGGGDLSTIA